VVALAFIPEAIGLFHHCRRKTLKWFGYASSVSPWLSLLFWWSSGNDFGLQLVAMAIADGDISGSNHGLEYLLAPHYSTGCFSRLLRAT